MTVNIWYKSIEPINIDQDLQLEMTLKGNHNHNYYKRNTKKEWALYEMSAAIMPTKNKYWSDLRN